MNINSENSSHRGTDKIQDKYFKKNHINKKYIDIYQLKSNNKNEDDQKRILNITNSNENDNEEFQNPSISSGSDKNNDKMVIRLKNRNSINNNRKSENINTNKEFLTLSKNNSRKNSYISKESSNINSKSEYKNSNDNQIFDPKYAHPYEEKDYDNEDLDQLDYDEALIYDKRTFCSLFCHELRERQLIAHTFCVKNKLKPFSIKLILFLFNIACYLVLNGFLFTEEYVMKILRRKSKNFYYFLVDSTKRIVYSSIIVAIINILIGLLFRIDKQIRKVKYKYKDNKIIFNGEIVKIYKTTKKIYIVFTIFNFIIMIIFIFYLFCFCGVYINCQLDWFEASFITFYLLQLIPVLVCFILAILRKCGLVLKIEFLFKINRWILDNI